MLITFQIILFIIISVCLFGVIGEQKDMELRKQLTAVCVASIVALTITFII